MPSIGPHCPPVARIASPAARLESVACVFATQDRIRATDVNMSVARKMPKYRTGTELCVARRRYPIAATNAAPATNGPRTPTRSETKAQVTIQIKHSTYGGAERPFDWIEVKRPISEMIVGTKRGSEAKQTLQPKYIRGGRKVR